MSKTRTPPNYRWCAEVTYRTDAGPNTVSHLLEEISELHNLVDRGPHWDTVIDIRIKRLNHCDSPTLTVEQAAAL